MLTINIQRIIKLPTGIIDPANIANASPIHISCLLVAIYIVLTKLIINVNNQRNSHILFSLSYLVGEVGVEPTMFTTRDQIYSLVVHTP